MSETLSQERFVEAYRTEILSARVHSLQLAAKQKRLKGINAILNAEDVSILEGARQTLGLTAIELDHAINALSERQEEQHEVLRAMGSQLTDDGIDVSEIEPIPIDDDSLMFILFQQAHFNPLVSRFASLPKLYVSASIAEINTFLGNQQTTS